MKYSTSFPVLFVLSLYLFASSFQVTFAHRLSKRAIVVLPARRQHQHTHLVFKRSPRTSNITDVYVHKNNNYELDSERRTLKKKRKRLRQLRDEVRELSSHVHAKRVYQGGAMIIPEDDAILDKIQRRKTKETHSRWRKQMSSRVKSIMKRLKKLEAGLKLGRNRTRAREKKRPMKAEKVNTSTARPISGVTTAMPILSTTTNIKIKRLHSSINQSKSGESGGVCFSHKDCKPGLCCHRISVKNGTVSSACFQHSLHEGDSCEDSCQCEARLHCFKNAPRLLTGAALMPPTTAICKKASTEDVVSGVYLNSKDSIFKTKPKRR
ncbi:hypothetical protein Tcan_15996 [Toxocara canis]|uniref:Uncharacterized protein n=1 Tax=Toxocara canis TaxID=6265 RepID=A0A0B2W384_TOXCA|nr:hypothetical protein Tcan_15996 [Toxocara canis]